MGIATQRNQRTRPHFALDCGEALSPSQTSEASEQTVVHVTGPYTITADVPFRFAEPYTGFEVINDARSVIGWDGETEVVTPYDDCVLVMPNQNNHQGQSAVRFGRLVD